jgi:hypothetical protein
MGGRHAARDTSHEVEVPTGCHDICPCGRRDPRTLSLRELVSDAKAYRRVQRAAARLRIVTDRRLELAPTPEWVVELADEQGDPVLEPAWVERAIARLDREARKHCPCRCHGHKTQLEVDHAARQARNITRAGARLQKTLDERLGRHTPGPVLVLAAQEDEYHP